MKIVDIIQPVLTVREHEMLSKAGRIHEDPDIHTKPDRMRMIVRLMKMGLLRQNRTAEVTTYEVTEKGKAVLKP